ncbi:MAG: BolA/IbaG family iron-sulfur metabolism protein [Acidobacteria bacterium]|nr:BolA/IbaG family iron-sulfur metabolism protein [Acidobacteriota bacterium]
MTLADEIKHRLIHQFEDAVIALTDTGGGDHWHLEISTKHLEGLSRVKQHQAIYKPLQDLIAANRIHALQIVVNPAPA